MAIINSPMTDHKQIYVELKKAKTPPKRRVQYAAIDYKNLTSSVTTTDFKQFHDNYTQIENKINI